jgi:hypothetical protein
MMVFSEISNSYGSPQDLGALCNSAQLLAIDTPFKFIGPNLKICEKMRI